jgi:ribosome-binding factor A
MSKWGFEKLREEIKRRLSEILQFEAHDPRFALITVMDVRLSADVHYATVYVSVLDGTQEAAALEALQAHRGYLRTQLAHQLHIRHTPELRFVLDETEKRAQRIEQLLERDRIAGQEGGPPITEETDSR